LASPIGFSCHFGIKRVKYLVFKGLAQFVCQSVGSHLGNAGLKLLKHYRNPFDLSIQKLMRIELSMPAEMETVDAMHIDQSAKFCPDCGFPDAYHRSDCQCVKENADIAMERLSVTDYPFSSQAVTEETGNTDAE
jgi:hypothetical protein